MSEEYIQMINEEYGTHLTGMSPHHGNKVIPKSATRIIVKDFGNGVGRVLYVDGQNRLISNLMESISGN